MLHKLYEADVAAGEAVTKPDVKEVRVFRIKTPGGKYAHVLTDLEPDKAVDVLRASEQAPAADVAAQVDRWLRAFVEAAVKAGKSPEEALAGLAGTAGRGRKGKE